MTKKAGFSAIAIRGIEVADWEDSAAIRESGNVVYNTLQVPYMSRDQVRDYIENMSDNLHMLVAVVRERVVGQLGLHVGSGRRAHSASLGMMIHADYQGRGIGTALMQAAVDLAENWLNVSRIELSVYPDNEVAITLYRKFGFEVEGTLRDYAFRDGRFIDSLLMARVRTEET